MSAKEDGMLSACSDQALIPYSGICFRNTGTKNFPAGNASLIIFLIYHCLISVKRLDIFSALPMNRLFLFVELANNFWNTQQTQLGHLAFNSQKDDRKMVFKSAS